MSKIEKKIKTMEKHLKICEEKYENPEEMNRQIYDALQSTI